MQVLNVLHAARWKYRTQKWRKSSPSAHHRTILSGHIFATKARIDNRKNLLLVISTGIASWQRYCPALQQRVSAKLCGVVQGMELPNFHRGRHLYSAGRPSRWASAHILVLELNMRLLNAAAPLRRSFGMLSGKIKENRLKCSERAAVTIAIDRLQERTRKTSLEVAPTTLA